MVQMLNPYSLTIAGLTKMQEENVVAFRRYAWLD